jgi:CubicO group peptidase (beta-lactamase class C family)
MSFEPCRAAPTTGIEPMGHCPARYAFVRDLLIDEWVHGGALGKAVAIVVDGEPVVHLWAGHADASRRAWRQDTLSCLFSASKPLAAACVLKLVERGAIGFDTRVAEVWPEFAKHGKQQTTVRHALAHLAGVPIAEAAPPRAVYDRNLLADALGAQRPLWPPGSQLCFHSFTHGVLTSELVRRTDGRLLPEFFRAEIAAPFHLELAFALTADELERCADVELVPDNALFRMMTDAATPLGRSWAPMPWDELNSRQFRESGFASIGGFGSALGLARFYAALANGGTLDSGRLLDSGIVREALTSQAHELDVFMGAPVRMGLAFMLANDVFPFTGPGAFGQPGLGGVVGFGDAARRLGVGIVCNRLSAGLENPFLQRLLEGLIAIA